MLRLLIAFSVYFALNYVVYRRLSQIFRLTGPGRKGLMLALLLSGGLLFVAWFLQFITPGDFHFLQYIGMHWTLGLRAMIPSMGMG